MTRESPDIVIISPFVPAENDRADPWKERFHGLYERLFNAHMDERFVWFSLDDSCCRVGRSGRRKVVKISLVRFIWNEVKSLFPQRSPRVYLIAYPMCRSRELLRFLLLWLLMAMIRNLSKSEIVLDVIDPPGMMSSVLIENKHLRKVIVRYRDLQERLLMSSCTKVIVNSADLGDFLKKKHGMNRQDFCEIPMGVDVCDYKADFLPVNGKFVLFYGGVLSEERGAVDLMKCVEKANQVFPVELICCGKVSPKLKFDKRPWLKVYDHLDYSQYIDHVSSSAHAGIIPYPVNDWWSIVSISKLATYAAAGLPVLSTNLAYTRRFIAENDMGLSFGRWDEVVDMLEMLFRDEGRRKAMSMNSRRAAEERLNWAVLAKKLEAVLNL